MSQTFHVTVGTDDHKGVHSTDQPDNDAALRSCFSGTSAPSTPTPIAGQLWYDTTNKVLKQYDGAIWVRLPRVFKYNYSTLLTANEAADGPPITHGLGTDQVMVMAMGLGSVGAGQWSAVVVRPDGYQVRFRGDDGNSASAQAPDAPATPSTGQLNFKIRNQRAGSQTIYIQFWIFSLGIAL